MNYKYNKNKITNQKWIIEKQITEEQLNLYKKEFWDKLKIYKTYDEYNENEKKEYRKQKINSEYESNNTY